MTPAERVKLSNIAATLEADIATSETALVAKVRLVAAIDYIGLLEAKVIELQKKQAAKDAIEASLPDVLARYP